MEQQRLSHLIGWWVYGTHAWHWSHHHRIDSHRTHSLSNNLIFNTLELFFYVTHQHGLGVHLRLHGSWCHTTERRIAHRLIHRFITCAGRGRYGLWGPITPLFWTVLGRIPLHTSTKWNKKHKFIWKADLKLWLLHTWENLTWISGMLWCDYKRTEYSEKCLKLTWLAQSYYLS